MADVNKRSANLDFIRVLSMFLVIAIHTRPWPLERYPVVMSTYMVTLFVANQFFYMISGQLNLKKKFNEPYDYKKYYIQKFATIIVPYAVVTLGMCFVDSYMNGTLVSIAGFFKEYYSEFMATNFGIHLWFMYPLIGLLLSVPFFSKIINNMTDQEIKVFFLVAFLWKFISQYLVQNFGLGFNYNCWILSVWTYTFFAGIFAVKMINEQNKKKWYIAGFVCYLISIFSEWKLTPWAYNNFTHAPAYAIFVLALYYFLLNDIKIKNQIVCRVLQFLSKYSFVVYLVHWHVRKYLIDGKVVLMNAVFTFIAAFIATTLISLLISIVLNNLLFTPIKNVIYKKWIYTKKETIS